MIRAPRVRPDTVRKLKDAYVRVRRILRPDIKHWSRPHEAWPQEDLWVRASAKLESALADPYAYAKFVFDEYRDKGDLYPNVFTSPRILDQFISMMPTLREDAKTRVRLDAEAVSTRVSMGESIRSILMDPHAELTPAFRYAAAVNQGLDDLADSFREEAEEMLTFEPFFRPLLDRWLPREVAV